MADASQSMDDGDADESASDNAAPDQLSPEMVRFVEAALAAWCAEKNFRDTTVNMVKLSQSIGVVRRSLSIYFDQHLHTTFRIWLSDIRFKEAQDYIKAHPEYTNESVSSACGFTSRSQLYKIFNDRTGMTPRFYYFISGLPRVIRLLGADGPEPVPDEQMEVVRLFAPGGRDFGMSQGERIDGKTVITSGPLLELEGKIVKVNARGRRATVSVPILGEAHQVDVGVIVAQAEAEDATNRNPKEDAR